ncbi:hypothetical protein HKX48_007155 [Thoreauomyces humboldtii]|nr:hypothetical protein HKX48_007155 [Thoreauomyces humboldtii]
MPEFKEFDCRVVVDGQPLEEYGQKYDEATRTLTVSVVAEEDKPYEVHINICRAMKKSWGATKFALDVRVDGSLAESIFGSRSWVCEGFETGNEVHPFRFASLRRANSATPASGSRSVDRDASGDDEVGTIAVAVWRLAGILPLSTHGAIRPLPSRARSSKKRALLSHATSFAPPKSRVSGPLGRGVYIDRAKPFLTVVFQYRSRELLEAAGIVPFVPRAQPSPSPVVIKRPRDATEVVALDTPVPERLPSRKRIKREHDDNVTLSRSEYASLLDRLERLEQLRQV